VPNLVPIKKREGGRRPPWIGCKLCLDLNEIFLVCILCCVGTKSEFGSSPSLFVLYLRTSWFGVDFLFWIHSVSCSTRAFRPGPASFLLSRVHAAMGIFLFMR
jgi:hypothetical protein